MRFFVTVLAVVVFACAARGASPQLLAELGKADALVREGCYACLAEAPCRRERSRHRDRELGAPCQPHRATILKASGATARPFVLGRFPSP